MKISRRIVALLILVAIATSHIGFRTVLAAGSRASN